MGFHEGLEAGWMDCLTSLKHSLVIQCDRWKKSVLFSMMLMNFEAFWWLVGDHLLAG